MEIIRLPTGQLAPEESDCVRVIRMPEGDYALNCNALQSCGDGDEMESVSLIGGDHYPTYDNAEAAGLAWANEHCAAEVYLCTLDAADVTD